MRKIGPPRVRTPTDEGGGGGDHTDRQDRGYQVGDRHSAAFYGDIEIASPMSTVMSACATRVRSRPETAAIP